MTVTSLKTQITVNSTVSSKVCSDNQHQETHQKSTLMTVCVVNALQINFLLRVWQYSMDKLLVDRITQLNVYVHSH